MFFLRSIRRRLVTGFTVALVLLLLMAVTAFWGLYHHQQALSDLNYLVHRSPDKAKLESAVTRILRPFAELRSFDSSQSGVPNAPGINLALDAAITKLRNDFLQQVQEADRQADEFWSRSEEAERNPLIPVYMNGVKGELQATAALSSRIMAVVQADVSERRAQIDIIRRRADDHVASILQKLNRLPDYDKQHYVDASLRSEQQVSTRMLKNVKLLVLASLISYGITIFFGFRWVSNPLRTISSGASRIANGDTGYRLQSVSRWKDEFADLTENFNLMADRFQESEEQLNAKVEERSRQLVRSERLAGVGFLSAGVAHEINNPLQAISMAAESIQMRLTDQLDPTHPDTIEVMDRLNMIQRESKRCGQITRRLLDFARHERQEKQVDDLTRVIGEVLAMIRPMSRYKDRNIVFERTAPLMVEINAGQMKQVILNLIANALQATNSGGTVEIHVEERTDWVLVAIRDDGQGMNSDDISNLFEPFYTTKETGQGTGLGLSITHRIVVDHNGTIDPRSEGRGRGSTFTIRLPRRQPQRQAA